MKAQRSQVIANRENRGRSLARGLWLAAALLLLCWGARLRFVLPQEPIGDADCYGYLNPALSKLTGGSFDHSVSREFLYPATVFLELCFFSDFRAITVCQHLVGLATGALLLVAWRELLSLHRSPPDPPTDARGLFLAAARHVPGFLAAFVYLGELPVILLEKSIRPEAVFAFFAVLSVWLNLRFIRLAWIERRLPAAWRVGAAGVFVSCVMFMLRPSCAFAVGFINLPLAVAWWSLGERGTGKYLPPVAALAAAGLLLFLPEALLRRGDSLATTLFPSMRLLVHSEIVLPQIDADLASGHPTRYDRAMLQDFRTRLADDVEESRRPENHPWNKLGFNPDYIWLHKDLFGPFFPADDPRAGRALAAFCNFYYTRAVLHHPLAMGRKVLGQFSFFYSFDAMAALPERVFLLFHPHKAARFEAERAIRFNDETLYRKELLNFSQPALHRLLGFSGMAQAHLRRCERLARSERVIPRHAAADFAGAVLDAFYLPILLLTLLAAGWVLAVSPWRGALGPDAWTTLLLYSYNFGVLLTVAVVFYLGQPRYIEMQRAFTLFSELAACHFLGRVLVAAVNTRNTRVLPLSAGERFSPACNPPPPGP